MSRPCGRFNVGRRESGKDIDDRVISGPEEPLETVEDTGCVVTDASVVDADVADVVEVEVEVEDIGVIDDAGVIDDIGVVDVDVDVTTAEGSVVAPVLEGVVVVEDNDGDINAVLLRQTESLPHMSPRLQQT